MTKEQKHISYHNYKIAKDYFKLQEGYVLHHVDYRLKDTDIERYIQWNINDLAPMPKGEHQRLHVAIAVLNKDTAKYNSWDKHTEEQKDKFRYGNKDKSFSEEHKQKISESNKGKHNHIGSNNPNYGKKHPGVGGAPKGSPKTKGSTGMHWYNNGIENKMAYECPDGYVKGRVQC